MRRRRLNWSRREMLQSLLGPVVASLATSQPGCRHPSPFLSGDLPPAGELLSPDYVTGHRLRDGIAPLPAEHVPDQTCQCVIVGGGIAGLSAAWHLRQSGQDDFVLLELESHTGGTSRSGHDGVSSYPWGAHYLPAPMPDNTRLVKFLESIDVLSVDEQGAIRVGENVLCREPEERVFAGDRWLYGLYPEQIADVDDRTQLERFQSSMLAWAHRRDSDGRRFFQIPTRLGSQSEEAAQLDQISMADWLQQEGYTSRPLLWLVDYACRDDYGLLAEQTSAWAGLFYFASRIADSQTESQAVMTWPEGNGYLADQLADGLNDRLKTDQAATFVRRSQGDGEDAGWNIDVMETRSSRRWRIAAEHVIMATPQFITQRIIDPEVLLAAKRPPVTKSLLSYGSWLVANLHLRDRFSDPTIPGTSMQMAWDNVIVDSHSLGYVASTHQLGVDHGETILTWYTALPSDAPDTTRKKILNMTWPEAAETVLSDLEIAHPDVRSLVTRLDVMRWGHAMVQPRVGTVFDVSRRRFSESIGSLHFAGTDLSGLALFEEAFDHGARAAEETLTQ